MAPQVCITNRSLPSSHDHIVSFSSFNSRERKVPDTFYRTLEIGFDSTMPRVIGSREVTNESV
mgnify:CR=1 FL=1